MLQLIFYAVVIVLLWMAVCSDDDPNAVPEATRETIPAHTPNVAPDPTAFAAQAAVTAVPTDRPPVARRSTPAPTPSATPTVASGGDRGDRDSPDGGGAAERRTPDPGPAPSPTPVDPLVPLAMTLWLADGQSRTAAASAAWLVEGDTDVARYEVAIGSAMGASDVLPWRDVGLMTAYQARNGRDGVSLALDPNQDYYLTVRAVAADRAVLGEARSGAWYVYEPYAFDVARYPSIMLDAPGSFREHKKPDWWPWDTINWDAAYEAYLVGSGAMDLYHQLGERVLIGSPKVTILQTENGFPARSDIVRIGPSDPNAGGEGHANHIASMLYDCDELRDLPYTGAYPYYEGCQTNPRKYAMTSSEMRRRLQEFVLVPETLPSFESEIFGEMGAPQVWAMPHAHPTDAYFGGDGSSGLRLGDWMFARYNILAVSPQPGPWAGPENPSLSGNYYNSLVVGNKSPGPSHYAQSSIDNAGGSRHKPDIAVSPSNQSEASSWSVASMAAAASAMLGLAYTEPLLSGSVHAEAMKAIILAGAGKDYLCPEAEAGQLWCDALPSAAEQWQWSNTETAPLDQVYGVGLFNYRNSFDILTAGRSVAGVGSESTGWDTRFLAVDQSAAYTFTVADSHDSFSLALTWFRNVALNDDGSWAADLPDFQVELLARDGTRLARSDDPHNNIEHIYLPEGLQAGRQYTIAVTLTSAENPTRYGLAWQTRHDATRNSPWLNP